MKFRICHHDTGLSGGGWTESVVDRSTLAVAGTCSDCLTRAAGHYELAAIANS
jgi:hypothetical protein